MSTRIYNPSTDVHGALRIANDYFSMTAATFKQKYPQVKVNVRGFVALVISEALYKIEKEYRGDTAGHKDDCQLAAALKAGGEG